MGYQNFIAYKKDLNLNEFLRYILYNKSFSKTFYLDLHIIYFYLLKFKFKGHFCGEDIYFIKESKTGYERIDIIGICEDIVKEVLVDFNIVDCAFLTAFTYITYLVSLIIATLIAQ